jgi:primary-amine oxidase
MAALTLVLSYSAELVLARPEPKVPARTKWTQNRGKKVARSALRHELEGRSWNTSAPSSSCGGSEAHAITAPYENLWAGLTDAEAVSVVAWLFSQTSLNLTATEDAGAWDNTV